MSSQDVAGSWDAARAARREDATRYATTLVLSILFHALLVLLVIWLGFRAPDETEQEIEVPIVFEEPATPQPPPLLPQEQAQAQPEPQPAPEEQEQEEPLPEDVSLLGFNSSEGEIEARPTRPQGPERDVNAPPAPVEADAPTAFEWVGRLADEEGVALGRVELSGCTHSRSAANPPGVPRGVPTIAVECLTSTWT